MKKLNVSKPTEPVPQAYRKNEMDSLPAKNLYGIDLKQLKSFKKLRQNFKKQELKTVFLHDVKQILSQLDCNGEDRFNSDLLVAILNLAEQFFVYPKNREEREQLKLESVIELMLPFFDNNQEYLVNAIGNVSNQVKKSNVLKRVYARMKLFFRQ